MKSNRQAPPPFAPVTLTLETQAEVDAIFSFLNHCHLTKAAGLGEEGSEWEALQAYCDRENCDILHSNFAKLIKR